MRVLRVAAAAAALTVAACAAPLDRFAVTEREVGSYSVVYRVSVREETGMRTSTTRLTVQRPYAARATGAGGGQVSNRTHLWQLGPGGEVRVGVRRAPGAPVRDASYAALRDAARAGAARAAGSATRLGRRCTWFAHAEPFPAALAPPGGDDRVESCVDGAGILLAEVWVLGGRIVRTTDAVGVAEGEVDDTFLAGRKVPRGSEAASAIVQGQTLVSDDEQAEPKLGLRVPDGWRRDRRAVVATAAGSRGVRTVVETYLRDGGDLVVVERGADAGIAPLWPAHEGYRDRVGAGHVRVVYTPGGVEVRFAGPLAIARITARSRETAMRFADGLRAPD